MFDHPSSKHWKASLVELESTDDGWTRHFLDPATNIRWIEYFPYEDDRSPSFMRELEIPTDIDVLLRECLTSSRKGEWIGVAAFVSGAFDTRVVARALESLESEVPRKALKSFGRYYQPYDRRKIVGMHYTEVESSYQEYLAAVESIEKITKSG